MITSRVAFSSSTTSTSGVAGPASAAGAASPGSGRASPPIRGRRTVNVEPRPSSLVRWMSPPIICAKRRLIASPRPVPPYLRVVEGSACVNDWNSRRCCSGVMPMPVSVTANSIHGSPWIRTACTSSPTRPRLRELRRVGQQVEQDLAHAREVGVDQPDVGRAAHLEQVVVLLDQRADRRRDVLHQRADVEVLEEQLHLAGLDLRQVEHVVDQREQVLAGARGSCRGRAPGPRGRAPAPPPRASRCSR